MQLGERKEVDRTFWALRFGLWMAVMILAAFVYLHYNPIVIANEPIPFKSFEIVRELKTDVAIVIDYDTIRNSEETFGSKDWSAAWIDTFEQEIGPITIATPNSLTKAILERSRILVLTASVASSVPDSIIEKIRKQVRKGLIVVLERPAGRLRETFSADGKGEYRKATAFSFGPAFGPHMEALKAIPLFGSFRASLSARRDSQTFMAFAGAPTVYSLPIGEGFALTVEFEFGKQIVALQQGLPSENFEVQIKDPLRTTTLTSDLVANEKLVGSHVPMADLLERMLVWRTIGSLTPIAAIWPFPKQSDGVLLFLHDDQELGDKSFWLGDLEKKHKAKGTFLFSHDAHKQKEEFKRENNELGFLWKIQGESDELQEKMGVLGWEPLTRPLGILTQHKRMLEFSKLKRVTTSRTADSLWLPTWDEAFRRFSKIGIRIDTSYEVEATSGYNFGTGFPFLALSRDGVPTGMREQPVLFPYGANRGPALELLLESSQADIHEAILTRLSTKVFSTAPDPDEFKKWTEVFDLAQKYNHKMMSVGKYDLFLRSRRSIEMRSRFTKSMVIPALPKNPRDEKKKEEVRKADRFRITINARRSDHAIVVPNEIGTMTVVNVREKAKFIDGKEVSKELKSDVVFLMGKALRRIPVPRGFSTVDVFYQEINSEEESEGLEL